jgi:hypothetical protein
VLIRRMAPSRLHTQPEIQPLLKTTFIIRIDLDGMGELNGVVIRARTGEKEQFHGLEALEAVIRRMLKDDKTLAATFSVRQTVGRR